MARRVAHSVKDPHLPITGQIWAAKRLRNPTQAKAACVGHPLTALRQSGREGAPNSCASGCSPRTANFVEAEYDGQFVKTVFVSLSSGGFREEFAGCLR